MSREHDSGLRRAPGLLLLSAAVLVYEVALTRVFSVVLAYHYAFLVLSGTLMGLSFGAVFEHYRSRPGAGSGGSAALWATLAGLGMTGSLFAVVAVGGTGSVTALLLVCLPGLFFAGAATAVVFRDGAAHAPALYAADLAGAALGAAAALWLLDGFSAPVAVLAAAAVSTAAGLALGLAAPGRDPWGRLAGAALVLTGLLVVGQVRGDVTGPLPIGRDGNKDLFRILANPSTQARILESRWSAFGRTDLVHYDADPASMALFVDGAAGTSIYRWNGARDDPAPHLRALREAYPAALPLAMLVDGEKDDALVIGAGGGGDVLALLLHGFGHVSAVEVNPDFVALVREHADYAGGLYSGRNDVDVVVAEGRRYVRSTPRRYDLILLSIPVTKSSRSAEGYALTESYLFTRESLGDYLDHLTPEGRLVVVSHGLEESVRLIITALATFADRGVATPAAMERLYLLGHPMMPVLVVRPVPVEPRRAAAIHAGLHAMGFDGRASYVPYAEQVVEPVRLSQDVEAEWRMMNQNLIDLAEGRLEPERLVAALPIDLSAPTDERPFFYKLERGMPATVRDLLWLAGLLLAAVVVGPGLHRGSPPTEDRDAVTWRLPLLFACTGAAYMAMEVALFQKLILYLGQPTLSVAVLLAALLAGGGLGSLLAGRVADRHTVHGVALAAAASALAVLEAAGGLEAGVAGPANHGANPLPYAAVVVGLLGVVSGLPLPLVLRWLSGAGLAREVPWLWGVNGAAAVVGSVLAVAVATTWGYSASLAGAAGLYLAAAALAWWLVRRPGCGRG